MSNLEKKFSDLQEKECKTEISPDILGPQLCVTCQKNPNWILPAAHWSDIKEAYLNENKCEYHVRVYEKEPVIDKKVSQEKWTLKESILDIGAERILVDLNKPLNSGTKIQTKRACYISDTYRDEYFGELGTAYLVAVPAFNFDQIEDKDSPDSKPDEDDGANSGDIVVSFNGLYRKFRQIESTLNVYKYYYSMSQRVGSDFVIRQKDNETLRISYEETKNKLISFRKELNKALDNKGYIRLGRSGLLTSKTPEKIKFVFKESPRFALKKVYVMNDCMEYVELPVKSSSLLKSESMAVVYNFLSNLPSIIKDITAKQTKPWLEFTLEHFYPEYIVDYGNLANNIDDVKIGLECLLEKELGLGGNGKVVDSLTKEIMSYFDTMEKQMAEQSCRDLTRLASEGATALAENKKKESKSPLEEREAALKKRYAKEFEKEIVLKLVTGIKDFLDENPTDEQIEKLNDEIKYLNSENIFQFIHKYDSARDTSSRGYLLAGRNYNPVTSASPFDVTLSWRMQGKTDQEQNVGSITQQIRTKEEALTFATNAATTKFNQLNEGGLIDRSSNSPHVLDALEAGREVILNFDNGYWDKLDNGAKGIGDLSLEDVLNIIGICGVSKLSAKAIKCLSGGITFDKFMSLIVNKTFDFLEVNTLNLFFNGLPAGLRSDLEKEIAKQIGRNLSLSTLLNLKEETDPVQKLKDILKTKNEAYQLYEISKKYEGNLEAANETEKNLFKSNLGDDYSKTMSDWHFYYGDADEDESIKKLKEKIKEHKISQKPFRNSIRLIQTALINPEQSDNILDVGIISDITDDDLDSIFGSTEELSAGGYNPDSKGDEAGLFRQIGQEVLEIANQISGTINYYNQIEKDIESTKENFKTNSESIEQLGRVEETTTELIEKKTALILQQKDLEKKLESLQDSSASGRTQEILNELKKIDISAKSNFQPIFESISALVGNQFVNNALSDPSDLNTIEQAAKSLKDTPLGLKVDAVYDVVFDYTIDYLKETLGIEKLFQMLNKYPIFDYLVDTIFTQPFFSCPTAPIFFPPPDDFLKSFKVDVCDPTVSLTLPKIYVPNINLRFQIEHQFGEIFTETLLKMISNMAVSILTKIAKTLESALCKVASVPARAATSDIDSLADSFQKALNTAFCSNGISPETSQPKSKELTQALFSPTLFEAGAEFEGSSERVSNIISSVASQREFLAAMTAREGEEDLQFLNRISNAINYLAPEMNSLLGEANQVSYFFKTLGSFLPAEDKENIRKLLDEGVPNLPFSQAICLTNEQLKEWNDLRKSLLDGEDVDQAVENINKATEKALDEFLGIAAELDSGGPFLGAASNEILKDVCNPDNLFNDVSQSELDKKLEDDQIKDFYDNILRTLESGFFEKGGLLGEATRDTRGNRERSRGTLKLFRPNYSNSQQERDQKYADAFITTKLLMGEDGEAIGVYPETVGLKQREVLLENGIQFNLDNVKSGRRSAKNLALKFVDDEGPFSYEKTIAASNVRASVKTFGYNLQILENVDSAGEEIEINFNIPNPLSTSEKKYLDSLNIDKSKITGTDIRMHYFSSIMRNNSGMTMNYKNLYKEIYEESQKNIIESLLTNYEKEDLLPIGYKFGYTSDDLTKASFEYTPSPNENELGTFASPRVIPLNPNVYGGTFSNPAFYVEPRKFTGWLELSTTSFRSKEGCDPKIPPILSFGDIEERTKNLSKTLRNDERLQKSPDCISVKPFGILMDSKNKSKLDGVVRSTIRTYLAEFFMKGYGLFSNLQISDNNFDDSIYSYILRKMKQEMSDLGTFASSRRIRIVRERYWYTFLEQCFEAYGRMIEIDGVEPPENVENAMFKIAQGLLLYKPINKKRKKRIKDNFSSMNLRHPTFDYDPLQEMLMGQDRLILMSVAFRLATTEEKENFFNGAVDENLKERHFGSLSSVKKLAFFQKIYFIKLFERECEIVVRELIKDELNRLSSLVIDSPLDKPYYLDLYKSFFGMKNFFPNSTSRAGLNSYEFDKQRGILAPGSIPTIMSSLSSPPVQQTDKVQFVVESYARLEQRTETELPFFITNRAEKYLGAISLNDLQEFISSNSEFLTDHYLSDFFGDLSFVYSSNITKIFENESIDNKKIQRIIALNPEIEPLKIKTAYNNYLTLTPFEDFKVHFDDSISTTIQSKKEKTTGSSGVKYGIRISVVLRKDFLPAERISELRSDFEFMNKCRLEKNFLFDDNTVMIPMASSEISVKDCKFSDFDPFNGDEPYDLECLINKMVETDEFKLLFDKVFGFRQASSMLAIYCMETLPAAIGKGEGERVEGFEDDPDIDDWDRVSNKFSKNFLRREFKSLYLSNTEDGFSPDLEDDDSELLDFMKINNPFDFVLRTSVKLPWWKSLKLKTKIYDANGQECADPEKDLL